MEALATHVRRMDAAVWRAAAAVLDLPQGVGEYGAGMEGPDMACSELGRQMTLPLRHGGLGLHMLSEEASDAAFVAGAGQAERNLKGRQAVLYPLQGASGASVRERWSGQHARYAEQCKWDATAKDLPAEFLDSRYGLPPKRGGRVGGVTGGGEGRGTVGWKCQVEGGGAFTVREG